MSEKIEPALSAEEWRNLEVEWVVAQGSVLTFWGDNDEYSLTRVYVREKRRFPAIIALTNAALHNSDRRKITREMVDALRAAYLEFGQTNEKTDRVLSIADALESYLPPA